MSEEMYPLFSSRTVREKSFVVFVTDKPAHVAIEVQSDDTTQGVARRWRQAGDLGAYAINVKPKVKP